MKANAPTIKAFFAAKTKPTLQPNSYFLWDLLLLMQLAASGDFLCHLIYINVYFRQDLFCCNTFVLHDLPLSSKSKSIDVVCV